MLYKIQHTVTPEDLEAINKMKILPAILKESLAKEIVKEVPVEFKDVSHPSEHTHRFEARIGVLTKKEYDCISKVIWSALHTGYSTDRESIFSMLKEDAPEFLGELAERFNS
jgi:hypothetical protein